MAVRKESVQIPVAMPVGSRTGAVFRRLSLSVPSPFPLGSRWCLPKCRHQRRTPGRRLRSMQLLLSFLFCFFLATMSAKDHPGKGKGKGHEEKSGGAGATVVNVHFGTSD